MASRPHDPAASNTTFATYRICSSLSSGYTGNARYGNTGSWDHDAHFDCADLWMYEDDAEFIRIIKEKMGQDCSPEWARQTKVWDAFVNKMWAKYRPTLPVPTDGWKQKHDDSYYRSAIEKSK